MTTNTVETPYKPQGLNKAIILLLGVALILYSCGGRPTYGPKPPHDRGWEPEDGNGGSWSS